ncbi:FMN-binding protein [Streptomyces sp. NBC_01239]|uniref:FMN-binding protein n=1 Tax=Streptomyces sp. NBC_01239 TaxID=2903792 RepID=UPI00224CB41F|nr:FMN-binding protein [Streptomyces sp. NBC_01239]MCX4809778.1 FMN-binding protein [Streptomyces sp. NBC_01239]
MKKSHPIRRVLLASAATVSGIVLLLSLKPASDPASASAQGAGTQGAAAAQESPQGGAAAAGTSTVTGAVAQTEYGVVQVRLTVAGGKITKAEAVQAPHGGTSDQKTALSVPKLNQEVVATQSADITSVSGATYTSGGYKQSLQSAIDKMKTAGAKTPAPSKSSAAGAGQAAQAKTVTGDVATTEYGPVQVRITVANGKITKAEAVQAPKGGTSDQKTALAIPKLNKEAVAAGSATIDSVSGASYTSGGYKQSLQSALDKAGG